MLIAPRETSFKALGWRILFGPAAILDGVIGTLTLGKVIGGFVLGVTRRLAFARIASRRK